MLKSLFLSCYTLLMVSPVLPSGLALGIIAFLLSLLPAAFFVWFWYLRRQQRALPPRTVALAFLGGIGLVPIAFWLEAGAERLWRVFSPSTVHLFHTTPVPLVSLADAILPAVAAFLVVALAEEGGRYLLMKYWFRFSKYVDQVFDGMVIGIGVGVGFATLENTLYFLTLFQNGSYDTLVFVFFLRFLISTLAHISFAGLMGMLLAQRKLEYLSARRFGLIAFFVPWFLHGAFDWLLALNFGAYSVVLLLPAIAALTYWAGQAESFIIQSQDGLAFL